VARKKTHPTSRKQLSWAFATGKSFAHKWARRAKRAGKLKKWHWGRKPRGRR